MMMTGSNARSLGWAAMLMIVAALVVGLGFHVHAVRSEVLLAERRIVTLERETLVLETELETRASQRQLAQWNAVDFGYSAPRAHQFLGSERQLAALGQPRGPGAPAPIRLARASVGDESAALDPRAAAGEARAMVSPVTGAPVTLAAASRDPADAGAMFTEAFGDFLVEASPIRPARAENARTPGRNALSAERSE